MNKRLLIAGGVASALALSVVAVFGLKEGNFPTYAAKVDSLDEEGLYSVVFNDFHNLITTSTLDDYEAYVQTGRGSQLRLYVDLEHDRTEYDLTLEHFEGITSYDIEDNVEEHIYGINNPRAVKDSFSTDMGSSEDERDTKLLLNYGHDKNDLELFKDAYIESDKTYTLDDLDNGNDPTWFDLYNDSDNNAAFKIYSIQVWYPTTVC